MLLRAIPPTFTGRSYSWLHFTDGEVRLSQVGLVPKAAAGKWLSWTGPESGSSQSPSSKQRCLPPPLRSGDQGAEVDVALKMVFPEQALGGARAIPRAILVPLLTLPIASARSLPLHGISLPSRGRR